MLGKRIRLNSKIPYWWRTTTEIRLAFLIGCCLRAKIQNRGTTNQRHYTNLCWATSSELNSLDPIPDVSQAREEFSPRRETPVRYNELRLRNFIPAGMSDHFGFRYNEMLLSNFQEREHISSAFHLVLSQVCNVHSWNIINRVAISWALKSYAERLFEFVSLWYLQIAVRNLFNSVW